MKKRPEWYKFQEEVAELTNGRTIKVYRPGNFGDVESKDLYIECKWVAADKQAYIRLAWIHKLTILARRYRKHPCLAIARGEQRILLGLCGLPDSAQRLLALWDGASRDVWYATGKKTSIYSRSKKIQQEIIPGLRPRLWGIHYGYE